MFESMQSKDKGKPRIQMEKLDFGMWGDHRREPRPYRTVVEGLNWYLNQEETEHLPEEIVVRLVAFNFGITMEKAVVQLNVNVKNESGLVDLS